MQELGTSATARDMGLASGAGMDEDRTGGLFALVKGDVDRAMAPLWPMMVAMASSSWDLDVRPSVVLRTVAFKALVTPAGTSLARGPLDQERDRWFVGLRDGEAALDATALHEGERRLISNSLARQFVRDVVGAARARAASLHLRCCENTAFIGAWTGAQP
jgi:hypothetical protein